MRENQRDRLGMCNLGEAIGHYILWSNVDYKSAIKKDMIVVNLVENTTLKRAELKKKLMFPTLNFFG